MPYVIRKFKTGYKVCKKNEPNKCFSNKPIPLENAQKQLKAIGMNDHLKGGDKKYKLLEIFKGTGSIGKEANKMGWEVISIDLEEKYKPDILTDILKWNYKKFYEETNFIPDFIWASPPCNTFSPLAYPLKERCIETAEPKSERAKLGTRILYRTLKIINFFKKLNPDLLFCLENPHGMMRKDKKIQKLHMTTTLYCLYGDKRRKMTDFFSNFDLKLKSGQCQNDTIGVCNCSLEDRYRIPPSLVKSILTQMKENYKKTSGCMDCVNCDCLEGKGKMELKQLLNNNDIGINEYLKIVKKIAKKKGYNPNLLTISNKKGKKLNYNGVDFGSSSNNDFITYSLMAKNKEITKKEADEHRRRYLARATNIKGDWKDDNESPNNLAIKILWDG